MPYELREVAAAGAASGQPAPFEVRMLGEFQLLRQGAPLPVAEAKALELLQALIAFGGTWVSTSLLADALWPSSESNAAQQAFDGTLHCLRKRLGADTTFTVMHGKLSLDRRQFRVDIWDFDRELKGHEPSQTAQLARLARARKLYRGHLLERESDKPWAIWPRLLLKDRFLQLVRREARIHELHGRWDEAGAVYRRGLEIDVFAEDLHRGLMACQRAEGDYGAALLTYRRCRQILADLLGIKPHPRTQGLYRLICQQALAQLSSEECADLCLREILHRGQVWSAGLE